MSVLWCAGMYGSGSTWVFNVMRGLAAIDSARPVHALFASSMADLARVTEEGSVHVIKTHDLPDDAAVLLHRQQPRVVATIRDPRDAVVSLMLYQGFPFGLALAAVNRSARFVAATAQRAGALVLRYESGFTETPDSIARIAEAIGARPDAADTARIFAENSREAVERLIGSLDTLSRAQRGQVTGDIYDPETQWHKHHGGRTGEVGRWRRAMPEMHIREIEVMLGDWMDQAGYERSATAKAASSTTRLGGIDFKFD